MLESDFIPAKDPNSKKLWIMMHGLGDSIEGYRWMPEAMNMPWMNYLLVNAPDEYYGGYSWFDFAGEMKPGVERSRQLLFELLDEQQKQGFEIDQTILGGFSQGSLMATDVGLRYPKPFAGVVGISGWVYEPEQLVAEASEEAHKRPVLMTHGTLDPMIPFPAVRKQVQGLISKGLAIEWHEFQKEHTIAGEDELRVIRSFVERCFETESV